jgi:hypothetical protein
MNQRIVLLLSAALAVLATANAATPLNKQQVKAPMKTEATNTAILKNQPIFSVHIEAQHVMNVVRVNGMDVYRDERGLQIEADFPVNQLMRNGENELTIFVWPDSPGAPLNPRAQVTISLEVRTNGSSTEKNHVISRVSYSNPLAHTAGATSISTPADRYDSQHGFRSNKQGDVQVGVTAMEIRQDGGITLRQKVTLPILLPEWEFFRSDDLPDVDKLSDDEYKSYYGSVLQIYQHVADALKRHDVDAIMPMFEERSREMDLAYYNPPGTTLTELAADLKKIARRPQTEMLPVEEKFLYTFRYPNNKLLKLVRPDNSEALVFNLNDIKASESYSIVLRRKNGQWFITR